MNENEVHAVRVRQINAVLPNLLKQRKGKTCLYVGATPWRFQLGEELHQAGYDITLLEIDKDNAYFYEGHPWLSGGVINGSVENISKLSNSRTWDIAVWWHGPEHIDKENFESAIKQLESVTKELVILAAPWGENHQPPIDGNAHQEHKSHLYPQNFEELGYKTKTCGDKSDLSTWPHILAWKTIVQHHIIYTAIFGEHDTLLPPNNDGEFVVFTDERIDVDGWEVVTVGRMFDDPRREARMYKTLSHQWLPHAESTLWIDGNVELLSNVDLFSFIENHYDIAYIKHPTCVTLSDEAELVIKLGKAAHDDVLYQMSSYKMPDLPACATGMLLRRHTDAIKQLNNMWWSEITAHTLRDQLSLPYCLHKLNIVPRVIDVNLYKNEFIRIHQHRGVL